MSTFKVFYSGNSTKYHSFEAEVTANSEREAVEAAYAKYLDDNYYPQEDGSILDCDGHEIATSEDNTIEYDGGQFYAIPTDRIMTVVIDRAKLYPSTCDVSVLEYDSRGNETRCSWNVSTEDVEYDNKITHAVNDVKERYEADGYKVITNL